MNDDELDQWLQTRMDVLDEKIAAVIDVDERFRQVMDEVAKDAPEGEGRSEFRSEPAAVKKHRKHWRPIRARVSISAVAAMCATLALTMITLSLSSNGPGTEGTSAQQHASDKYAIDFATTCARPAANSDCPAQASTALRLAEVVSTDDTTLRVRLLRQTSANTKPLGDGPWPFVVMDTDVAGLYARSTNSADSSRVGIAANRSIVWGDCVAVSDFEPGGLDPLNVADSTWLRVHWKHQLLAEGQGFSDPTEAETAWMYLGYLAPLQQNGKVVDCNGTSS